VTDIPIPFIGGAEGPRREWPAKQPLEPPFAPGGEAEVETGPEEAAIADEFETELDETFEAEAEPVVIEIEEPIAESVLEDEPGSVDEPPVAPSAPAVTPGTPGDREFELPDFLLGSDAGDVAQVSEELETTAAFEFVAEQPEPPPESAEDTLAGTVRLETGGRLAEKARELLDGERGDWIRTLIADLRGYGHDVTVPRAFAAGYLAAKKEEER
jgi:hypothetical protein